jgi:hypothetical protein
VTSLELTWMLLTRRLAELFSDKRCLRIDRSKLALFEHNDGIIPIATPPGPGTKITGNVLVDRSLTSPIQVRAI